MRHSFSLLACALRAPDRRLSNLNVASRSMSRISRTRGTEAKGAPRGARVRTLRCHSLPGSSRAKRQYKKQAHGHAGSFSTPEPEVCDKTRIDRRERTRTVLLHLTLAVPLGFTQSTWARSIIQTASPSSSWCGTRHASLPASMYVEDTASRKVPAGYS
jgi:hypothetical protein